MFGEKSTHPNNITGTHARDQPKEEIHIHMTYASLLCSLARFWWKIHTSHQKSAANKLMQLPSLRLTSDSTISQVKHTWHQPKLAFRTHTWITPINFSLLPDFGEKLIHPNGTQRPKTNATPSLTSTSDPTTSYVSILGTNQKKHSIDTQELHKFTVRLSCKFWVEIINTSQEKSEKNNQPIHLPPPKINKTIQLRPTT